jgi:hypothetical protein
MTERGRGGKSRRPGHPDAQLQRKKHNARLARNRALWMYREAVGKPLARRRRRVAR